MRKHCLSLLAVAAIGLTATMASAADLPRKAPAYVPPPPPPLTWTGCYIGANIGGIFGRVSNDFNNGNNFFNNNFNNFDNGGNNNSGFAGGGQIGCDYQWAGSGWVIGFRNMFDGTSLRRDRDLGFVNTTLGDFHLHSRVNWFDTLTGRIGYAFAPGWLLYGQGGVAWFNHSSDLTVNGINFGSFDRTRTGWTAGGGVEWMWTRGWSVFLEGNYMDFGDQSHVLSPTGIVGCPAAGCAFTTHAKAATVLVGLNYRFGWGKAPGYGY